MKVLIAILMLGVATPAIAQHSGHTMPMPMPKKAPTPKPSPTPAPKSKAKPAPASAKKAPAAARKPAATKPKPATASKSSPTTDSGGVMDHGAMDHTAMSQDEDSSEQMDHSQMDGTAMEESEMDHSTMDHDAMQQEPMDSGAMDHAAMGHGDMAHDEMTMPIPETPPPAAAGFGPARAADTIWGADAMRASREELATSQGGQKLAWFMADRAEYRLRDGRDGYLWDVQGFYGGDLDKFWFKSEGEGAFGEKIETAEVQALWSHAIGPFFDLQAGIRQDFAPRDRTYAVVGVQGIAPYLYELDLAAFLSDRGDLTARLEGEIDQRITQRLILQPRAEVELSAQDVPELGIGAGIDTIELGLRLRYEIAREFAPYIGVEQEWKVGQSADYARAAGEDSSVTNYVIGVRFWF